MAFFSRLLGINEKKLIQSRKPKLCLEDQMFIDGIENCTSQQTWKNEIEMFIQSNSKYFEKHIEKPSNYKVYTEFTRLINVKLEELCTRVGVSTDKVKKLLEGLKLSHSNRLCDLKKYIEVSENYRLFYKFMLSSRGVPDFTTTSDTRLYIQSCGNDNQDTDNFVKNLSKRFSKFAINDDAMAKIDKMLINKPNSCNDPAFKYNGQSNKHVKTSEKLNPGRKVNEFDKKVLNSKIEHMHLSNNNATKLKLIKCINFFEVVNGEKPQVEKTTEYTTQKSYVRSFQENVKDQNYCKTIDSEMNKAIVSLRKLNQEETDSRFTDHLEAIKINKRRFGIIKQPPL